MRIYFSGGTGKLSAEFLLANRNPHVMLTYVEIHEHPTWTGWAKDRLEQHIKRKRGHDPEHQPNKWRAMKTQAKKRLPNTRNLVTEKKVGMLHETQTKRKQPNED